MPATVDERLQNFEKLMPLLKDAGICPGDIYLDPLIFPASVDARNSKEAIDAIRALRERYGPEVHLNVNVHECFHSLYSFVSLSQ